MVENGEVLFEDVLFFMYWLFERVVLIGEVGFDFGFN